MANSDWQQKAGRLVADKAHEQALAALRREALRDAGGRAGRGEVDWDSPAGQVYRDYKPAPGDDGQAERLQAFAQLLENENVRGLVTKALTQQEQSYKRKLGMVLAAKLMALPQDLTRIDDHWNGEKMRACNATGALGVCKHPDSSEYAGAVALVVRRKNCGLRVCPQCMALNARKLQRHYQDVVRVVTEANEEREERMRAGSDELRYGFKHLVLTQDGTLTREQMHKLTRKLVRHFWPDQGPHGWEGALATYERGEQGNKGHTHSVVNGRWADKFKVSAYLEKNSRGHAKIIHIKSITPERALGEVLKYVTKMAKLATAEDLNTEADRLLDLYHELKGKRRVWSWGCFFWTKKRREAYMALHPGKLGPNAKAPAPPDLDPDNDELPDELADAGDHCQKCEQRFTFATFEEARWLLGLFNLKSKTNSWSYSLAGPHSGAGIGARAGPGP